MHYDLGGVRDRNGKESEREFVSKKWGYEDILCNSELYCGKILFIKKGKRLSLHFHKLKTETFYVQSGKLFLEVYTEESNLSFGLDNKFKSWKDFERFKFDYSGIQERSVCYDYQSDFKGTDFLPCPIKEFILEPGDTITLPVGTRHTLYAKLDTHIFEFSTQHFDSDSYRVISSV